MKKPNKLVLAVLLSLIKADQLLFLEAEEEQPVGITTDIDPLAWMNKTLPAEERASLLVQAMTLTEKALIVGRNDTQIPGVTDWTGNAAAIDRLRVPQINYQDGPQGFRDELHHGTTTAWPSALAFGTSWDAELTEQWGQLMGKEFRDKGAGVQLGPGMNVLRIPVNGRSFEYISGEDPVIGAELSPSLIKGIQSNGILANAKHFINNNQEVHRIGSSSNIDERTMVEMYMPPFESSVKAGVGSLMCSYNKINSDWACAHNATLNKHLRENLGFDGFVMSDWGAVHSHTQDYIPFGLDQEQNGQSSMIWTHDVVEQDVKSGKLKMEDLDRAVHRITKSFIKAGLYDDPPTWNFARNVTSVYHSYFAMRAVENSTILLKNDDDALPLNKLAGKWLLVLGNAASYPKLAGTGSGQVHMKDVYPPIWALCDELEIDKKNFPLDSIMSFGCNERKTNCIAYVGDVPSSSDSSRNFDKNFAEDKKHQVNLKSLQQMPFDATLIFGGVISGEGDDRRNLTWQTNVLDELPKFQKKGKIIGAITAPGPLLLNDLKEKANAILFNVMPGQEYSRGLMNILFGRANPSAKLAFTMPNIDNEQQMTEAQYPGTDNANNVEYTEKHHFGYRWYDQNKVKPSFEFGLGLSYTKFEYSLLNIDSQKRTLTFTIKNVGKIAGSEVVQVYLGVPETENFTGGYKSPKSLKAFTKVKDLAPGQHKEVEITLPDRAFSYWNVSTQQWTVEKGIYKVMVGASSRDIRMAGHLTI